MNVPIQLMQVRREDDLSTLTDRAVALGKATGNTVQFDFDRKRYQCPAGSDYVQLIGSVFEVRETWTREPESVMDPRLYETINYVTREIVPSWSVSDIANVLKGTGTRYVLIAGPNTKWLSLVRDELFDALGNSYFESITQRTIRTCAGQSVQFEVATIENEDRFRGVMYDYAFLEERQKEIMGGNYNEFPWVDKSRSSWERRRDRAIMQQDKEAEYLKVEAAKEKARVEAKEMLEAQARTVMMKSRNIGVTSLSEVAQFKLSDAQLRVIESLNLDNTASKMFRMMESTATGKEDFQIYPNAMPGNVFWTSGRAITEFPERSATIDAAELLNRLQVVERVLGRHLREQLAAAPSNGSVYAQGPGYAVTAMEIRQVVQALDLVSGMNVPTWRGMDLSSADFTAESEDGEKIVLSKDGDRFDSGVLFDPSNRPIRKFKLKEMAA